MSTRTDPVPGSPIRIGIVGVGKIAADQHIPSIRENPAFRLIATASPSSSVPDVPAYPALAAMLADHALDAVALCTPPSVRLELALEAVSAGLDVLLEKPPVDTLVGFDRLTDEAARQKAVVYTTWHSREAAGVDAARRWLRGKTIKAISVEWRENIRQWHPGQDWILTKGGFGVFDPGINAVSIVTALVDEPIVLESSRIRVPENREAAIAASLQLRCGTTPIGADFDFLEPGDPRWTIAVETDGGPLTLSEGGKTLQIGRDVRHGDEREYPRLYARFAQLIGDRQSDIDTEPLELVLAAQERAEVITDPPFVW